MKMKIILLSILSVLIIQSGYSQNKHAEVYFVRSVRWNGTSDPLKILIDSQIVCNLTNKKYSYQQVSEGVHIFTVWFTGLGKAPLNEVKPLKMLIKVGNVYYIELLQENSGYSSLYCKEIDEASGKRILMNATLEEKCL